MFIKSYRKEVISLIFSRNVEHSKSLFNFKMKEPHYTQSVSIVKIFFTYDKIFLTYQMVSLLEGRRKRKTLPFTEMFHSPFRLSPLPQYSYRRLLP